MGGLAAGCALDSLVPEVPAWSENDARRYLLGFCWSNYQRYCPRCRGRKIARLPDDRWRCRRCRYPFHDFSGRWINRGNLSCSRWLQLVRLFAADLLTIEISARLDLAYNTAYKAVLTLRQAITARCGDADGNGDPARARVYARLLAEGKPEREEGRDGDSHVFGIREEDGRVRVRVLPLIRPSTVFCLSVKKVRRAGVTYTDRFADYDALIFCSRQAADGEAEKPGRRKVHLDTTAGFWPYLREKLVKHRGITPERFPLYLKELEFRYNHRNEDLFPTLVRYLCEFMPSRQALPAADTPAGPEATGPRALGPEQGSPVARPSPQPPPPAPGKSCGT